MYDRKRNLIKVGEETKNYSHRMLIIHEIAHAVTTDDHGDEWVAQMRRVETKAAESGKKELAEDLNRHIAWVTSDNAYDVTEDDIYTDIHNAAQDQPNASFEEVVGHVAREYGQTLETFLHDYPRAREVFDGAHP